MLLVIMGCMLTTGGLVMLIPWASLPLGGAIIVAGVIMMGVGILIQAWIDW